MRHRNEKVAAKKVKILHNQDVAIGFQLRLGGTSKQYSSNIGLDEDFVFDQQEAMTDPKSDSAKLMNAHVDRMVQGRVSEMLSAEKRRNSQMQKAIDMKSQEDAFKIQLIIKT